MDSPWLECADEWKEIQRIKQKLKEREEQCRETLIALTENGSSQGGGIRVTQYSRKGRIAYDKIPLLKEMNLESYRQKTVQAWKITAV
ncbi:MAG TPA: hypothetical protein VJK48_01560 [Chlamydiales bacterium]|nr:hypothetical protein [Chlamydiales bacterium]